MKKWKWILLSVIGLALLASGCRRENQIPLEQSLAEYFPVIENTLYEYEGIMMDSAAQSIYNTYVTDNRIQRFISTPVSERSTDILAMENGQLLLIFSDGYQMYPDDLTEYAPQMSTVLLQEPLVLGASWNRGDDGISEITAVDMDVETPYGTFQCLEVSTLVNVRGEEYHQKDYYSRGIGLVKSLYWKDGGTQIGNQLKSIEEDTALDLPYYHFDPVTTEIDYDYVQDIRSLSLHTNQDFGPLFEEQFKISSEGADRPCISENTQLLGISVDRAEDRMTVDFSRHLAEEMNAGAGLEMTTLHAIVNTLGNFYRVSQVQITLEGNPYESGHISMAADEFIDVFVPGMQPTEEVEIPEDAIQIDATDLL